MLQPPVYGFCLSDGSDNKERGNDERMKKIEGCRWSVSFVRRSVHASSKEEEMREQEERRWEKKKKKVFNGAATRVSEEPGIRGGVCFVSVCESLQCAGRSTEGAASRCRVRESSGWREGRERRRQETLLTTTHINSAETVFPINGVSNYDGSDKMSVL